MLPFIYLIFQPKAITYIILLAVNYIYFLLITTEYLFNLKFAVKELARNSRKCEKEEQAEKIKTKKAIQKGNMEGARIHAENAIRQKNQALIYLRMSGRVDAVANRVQIALTTRKVVQF